MVEDFFSRIKTPSELRFARALEAQAEEVYEQEVSGELSFAYDNSIFILKSQFRTTETKRADFAIFRDGREPQAIVMVEIDDPSHWKEKWKESSDRVRDRETALRWLVPTMRFTNSEVGRDPMACALEVLKFIALIVERDDSESQRVFCWGLDSARNSATEASDRQT